MSDLVVPHENYEHFEVDTSNTDRRRILKRRRVRFLISGIVIAILVVILIGIITAVKLTDSQLIAEEKGSDDELERIWSARSFLDNPRFLGVILDSGSIIGLTVLNSQLFVQRGRSAQMNVYNTSNLILNRNITIKGSSGLEAIVASPRYNCLYIKDEGRNIVYRYNISDNVISSWPVGGKCEGLSLTSAHNVLVTLWETKQIKEYTPDGSLVREIYLDSSVVFPYHSVQLSSDQFVVCHGNGGSLHRVCIVDTSGRIVQCYGGSEGSGVGQLSEPRYLAVDRHGNVLVADWGNTRVVLLSPSLTHLGYITIPGHKLSDPYALHLDLLTRRLYIGDGFSRKVFVLSV